MESGHPINLLEVVDREEHDERYFAMLHNAVAIKGNKRLEGGATKQAVGYYNYLLFANIPNFAFNFNLTSIQFETLMSRLKHLEQLHGFIDNLFARGQLYSNLDLLMSLVNDQISSANVAYLPAGYQNLEDGHFACLKIRLLENRKYALSYINQGDGIQYHPIVSESGTKTKYSYQSDEYEIDLNTADGRKFLQKTLELKYDSQKNAGTEKTINQYNADDFIGLLISYGKKLPTPPKEELKEKAVTIQRGGSCSVTTTHAVARDILVDMKVDLMGRKRFHFGMKLRSLMIGFDAYKNGKISLDVFDAALTEFNVRMNKLYRNVLTDEEYNDCAKLYGLVQARIIEDKKEIERKSCESTDYPIKIANAPSYRENIYDESKIQASRDKKPVELIVAETEEEKPAITPDNIKNLLAFNLHANDKFPFNKYYELLNACPHCSGQAEDKFWDKVPQEDIKDIIDNVFLLLRLIAPERGKENDSLMRARSFAMALMAYDIIAQLAPRDDRFKLGKDYTLGLDDVYSQSYDYNDADTYYTVKRITQNFATRAHGKNRVFTNTVNLNNKYDNTIHYVINVLLSDKQRLSVTKSLMQKNNDTNVNVEYSDVELFRHLMDKDNIHMSDDDGRILDQFITNTIAIACIANNLGPYISTVKNMPYGMFDPVYQEANSMWYFTENQLVFEEKRKASYEVKDNATHLPKFGARHGNDNQAVKIIPDDELQPFEFTEEYEREQAQFKRDDEFQQAHIKQDDEFQQVHVKQDDVFQQKVDSYKDFSENSIIQSEAFLSDLRDKEELWGWLRAYDFPYPTQLTGSMQPYGKVWQPPKQQSQLYEELSKAFKFIECTPNFQIVKTFDWARHNIDKLSIAVVRTRIRELLFQYGKLDNALVHQLATTMDNMQQFLIALLTYCQHEANTDIELHIWAADLVNDLKYYAEAAAKLYQLPITSYNLPSFNNLILNDIAHVSDADLKSRLANQVICSYRNRELETLKECCLILICRVAANLGDSAHISDGIWQKLQPTLLNIISNNKNEAEIIINQYIKQYNISPINHWSINGSIVTTGNDFYIDMISGSWKKIGENAPLKERTAKTITDNKELFDELPIDTKHLQLLYSLDSKVNKLQSVDGKWEFVYEIKSDSETGTKFSISQVYQTIKIEEVISTFKLIKPKNEIDEFFGSTNPFESRTYAGSIYEYWQSIEDNNLIFVRHKKDNVGYTFSKDTIRLVNWPLEASLNIDDLEQVSSQNNHDPLLIKHGDRILMYGYVNNVWDLRALDHTNEAFMKAIQNLQFPKIEIDVSSYQIELKKLQERYDLSSDPVAKEIYESTLEIMRSQIETKLNEQKFKTTSLSSNITDELKKELLKGHAIINNKSIHQFQTSEHGEWQRDRKNGKELLNLISPQTDFEREWAHRLGPLFGLTNIRCTATLNGDKTKWHVERIEHLLLKLSFTIDRSQNHLPAQMRETPLLMCNEEPGYFLSTQQSIPALHGFPGIVILENALGHKKYLIPAFKAAKGEDNNAFNTKEFMDFGSLCNDSQPYYHYTLNEKGELNCDTLEGNLYLAILYRNLGNFDRAIHYLNLCKKHENISETAGKIVEQVLGRKILTPSAAAFDLKVIAYLREQQSKWSAINNKKKNKIDKPYQEPPLIQEQIGHLLNYYKKTSSSYKQDITIIPKSCRLTKREFKLLNPLEELQNSLKTMNINSKSPMKRLEAVSSLPQRLLKEKNYATYYVNNLLNSTRSKVAYTEQFENLKTWRSYHLGAVETCRYLTRNFVHLFKDAISDDTERLAHLNITLFSLLQNDTKPEVELYFLISLLLFARQFKQYFANYSIPSDSKKLIIEVGEIFHLHGDELRGKKVYLFDTPSYDHELLQEKSFESDFTATPVHYGLAKIHYEKACEHPLGSLAKQYFTKEAAPIAKGDFQLEEAELGKSTLLERNIFNRLQTGHNKNKQKLKQIYKPINKSNLQDLKNELLRLKEDDEGQLKLLIDKLLYEANATPLNDENASISDKAQAYNLEQARLSGNKRLITMNDLFSALLEKDPTRLTEQNYFLQQTDVENLLAALVDCALLSTRIAQSKEALDKIGDKSAFTKDEEYKEQILGAILDKPRVYDIKTNPEFLLYEYATNRLLRDDQVAVLSTLISLIENKSNQEVIQHALLQFAAGGGKTSVLIPILAKRFASVDLLPVIINTNELYEIGLQDIPKSLQESFKQHLEVIERELDYKWTKNDLTKLLQDLNRWKLEGKCLLLKSITWHSINICKKAAYFKNDIELATAAQNVLDFFKTNTVKLEDECHIVSDPMQQSIQTDGKPVKIPTKQLDLLMRCYDYLMGRKGLESKISELAGIKAQRQSPLSQDELITLQQELASALVKKDIFSALDQSALLQYLLQDDKKRPHWLFNLAHGNQEARALANNVVLARAFLYTHLPHILSLKYLKDFGTSIHDGDLTAAPKHEGNSVSSHFGDPMLVTALTIQLYEEGGLRGENVDQLLQQLTKEHNKERKWNINQSTQAEIWLGNIIPSFKSIKDLTAEMKEKLRTDPTFMTHEAAIKKFLVHFALPQVQIPPNRITSTPAEMQAGFSRSIMFSATPGLPETYPAFLNSKNCFLEESFEAQVVDTLLQEQNKEVCILKKTQNPKEFFAQFSPDTLEKMHTLIDRGALLTDYDPAEVIMAYLGLNEDSIYAEGAAHFTKQQTDSKQTMQLVSSSTKVKSKEIAGAGLVQELKKQGIDPETFLLFLFLDISKATGTDILRPYTNNAGLTIGKGQTVTETIQAAMRQRKLLEDDAQTVTWVMFQELYRSIYNEAQQDTFDRKKLIYWMIKNEAKDTENKIVNSAYQGIEQAIKEVIWTEIAKNPSDFEKYAKALEEKQATEPYYLYELESNKDNSVSVLKNYTANLLNKFNLSYATLPWDIKSRIDKIIDRTRDLIDQLDESPNAEAKLDIGVEVEQEMVQQVEEDTEMETQIKTKNDARRDHTTAVETYDGKNDDLSVIFNENQNIEASRYKIPAFVNCDDIKQPSLLICPEHFRVLQPSNDYKQEVDALDELKPINNVLVRIMPGNQMEFVACSAAGFEFYSDLIRQSNQNDQYPVYAIISINGSILFNRNNFDLEEVQELNKLVATDQCQKMLTYIHFLNGEISNPLLLSQIVQEQGWDKEQYKRLAQAIMNAHVSQHPITLLGDEIFESFCGWNNKRKISSDVYTRGPAAEVTFSKDDQRTSSRTDEIPMQSLKPVTQFTKPLKSILVTPIAPQRVLGNDLFGEQSKPVNDIPFSRDEFEASNNQDIQDKNAALPSNNVMKNMLGSNALFVGAFGRTAKVKNATDNPVDENNNVDDKSRNPNNPH